MTFEESMEYMQGLNKRGIKPGLEGIRSLCDALSNPEADLKFIQVAGTNGKGSTALFVSNILKASGLKVGVYASPSVFDDLEIIKVNGRNISKKDYSRLVEDISKVNDGCTRFEVETALAFMYFKEKQCDIVVLEAGMGGALDATNVVTNTVMSVITSIGMDHMQFLGDTIEKIALNKAGIFKDNSSAVTTRQEETVLTVLEEVAKERNVSLALSDYEMARAIKYKASGTTFDYKGFKKFNIHLLGTYQIMNACLSIDVCLRLRDLGYNISDKAIYKGLDTASEEGRFEKISDNPLIYIDGAHNLPAARVLKDSLQTYCNNKKFIYIMGMFKDKASEDVARLMTGDASMIITVTLPNKERSLSNIELAEIISTENRMVSTADSIYEAVEMACLMADKDTAIVAFGSLSHLKEVKRAVNSLNPTKMRGLKV